MKASPTIDKLAAALAKAQGALTAVVKDRTNPHFRNTYATLDAIIATVRPVLATNQLALLQGAAEPLLDEAGRVCALTVETRLLHASGEWIENAITVPLAKVDPQGAGSALTYGRRYSVAALLALATDDDDDAEGATVRADIAHPARPQAVQPVGTTAPRQSTPRQEPLAGAPGCPKCDGAMWDNRGTPEKPKLNPKAPDWKCRDTSCDGVIWPPKEARA